MDAAAHSQHDHHDLPTSGSALNSVAFSATLHCLTGCAIGEVTGMIIGTALGFSDLGTIALAVALAFLFGYSLTSLPLLRAGLALSSVIPIALATDTFSIAVMEIVDNGIMLAVPGAMEAGVGDILFWGALSVALAVAGVVAFPVNRWLITKGKGHAVLHETGIHGGPPTRVVAFIAATAAAFGTAVLVGDAVSGESGGGGHGGDKMAASSHDQPMQGSHGKEEQMASGAAHKSDTQEQDPVRGLAVSENGMRLDLARTELPRGRRNELRYRVVDDTGQPVRDYEIEHDKRMHLIVARRDLTGFQHLHPELGKNGVWRAPITLAKAGSYRVFADFKRRGENHTLASDLAVDGPADLRSLPAVSQTAETDDGYRVSLDGGRSTAEEETELGFTVTRGAKKVHVQDYLGAKGHLVALREGDLAYLHVHPVEARHGGASESQGKVRDDAVSFATEFPSAGRYRLFLQFKHRDKVHTAAFTKEVAQ